MKNPQIVFTAPFQVELSDAPLRPLLPDAIRVQLAYSTISPGTEKANLIGDANVAGQAAPDVSFPRTCGYSSAGTVVEIGSEVKDIAVGDKVIPPWSKHMRYVTVKAKEAYKLPADFPLDLASEIFISTFPLAAIRKCHLEVGEPALVMGLGLLGIFAVGLLRASGAAPIVAVDPIAERREEALSFGADYAFDPYTPDFAERVKQVTGGGAAVAIEVTGVGAGLDGALDCMRRFGRVALLGCTRNKEFSIDYYRKVHCPGISLIGAHTRARPAVESSPGMFTDYDDVDAIVRLHTLRRIDFTRLLHGVYSPDECAEVFARLLKNDLPTVAQFDWGRIK